MKLGSLLTAMVTPFKSDGALTPQARPARQRWTSATKASSSPAPRDADADR